MRLPKLFLAALMLIAIATAFAVAQDWDETNWSPTTLWRQAVVPGALSGSHAFLTNNCAACHAPIKGVEPKLCIACHADNTALLQREPTAFHAQIQVCSGCHVEHQAGTRMPTTMDHPLLAQVGHRELRDAATSVPGQPGDTDHPRVGDESMLNCSSCHSTKDRHQGFLGTECAQCHATTQWTLAGFRHPSPSSTECMQCHKPPPSHNMMHFSMMSAPIARQPGAKVAQCFLCHQTTSWNDIKGVGRVKHH